MCVHHGHHTILSYFIFTMKLISMLLFCVAATNGVVRAAPASSPESTEASISLELGCKTEYLMVLKSDSEGTNVSVLVNDGDDSVIIFLLSLESQHPPSDLQCGKDRFRCKHQLILRDPSLNNSSTVFVPLHSALLLVNFVSNDTHLFLQEYHLINLTNHNCSPITTIKIASSIYTVCLNLERSYLSLFEVRLNTESLSRSFIVGPLIRNYFELSTDSKISEFKYVELYRFHFIYFAISNYLYYFEPLDYVLDYVGELPRNCTSVRELVDIGDDTLVAHCNNQAVVYFNLAYQYWTQYRPYSEYGRPYTCQDHATNNQLNVFAESGYIQHTRAGESNRNTIELIGENFISGECFGVSSGFYFVYVDGNEGIFVLDLSTFNFTQLSTQSCNSSMTNSECNPVRVLNNRYVIVQQFENYGENVANTTTVFDSQNSFEAITILNSTSLNLLTVLTDTNTIHRCSIETESPTIYPSTTTSTTIHIDADFTTVTTDQNTITIATSNNKVELNNNNQNAPVSNNFTVGLAIGISVTGLVIIVLLVVATLIIIVFSICRLQTETGNSRHHMSDTTTTKSIILTTARKVPDAYYGCETAALGSEKHSVSTPLEMEHPEKGSTINPAALSSDICQQTSAT